jgi:hypothetical protein
MRYLPKHRARHVDQRFFAVRYSALIAAVGEKFFDDALGRGSRVLAMQRPSGKKKAGMGEIQ